MKRTVLVFVSLLCAGHIPTGDLLAAGILTINGYGSASAIQTTGKNGLFTLGAPIVGPYTIDADCTGKVFSEYVVVQGGEQLYAISETNGNNVALHGGAVGRD